MLNNNVTGTSDPLRVVTFASAKRMTGITDTCRAFLKSHAGYEPGALADKSMRAGLTSQLQPDTAY